MDKIFGRTRSVHEAVSCAVAIWLIFGSTAMFVGCADGVSSLNSRGEIAKDPDFAVFVGSRTFARIKAAGFRPAIFGERDSDAGSTWVEVQAGVNASDRFDTWAKLRISKDGRIDRWDFLTDGWVDDSASFDLLD